MRTTGLEPATFANADSRFVALSCGAASAWKDCTDSYP
jgi:hypothetical protein